MDLFLLLQTTFEIFASFAIVVIIASFIAYKIKQSSIKDKEKIIDQSKSTLRAHLTLSREDIVHTVALPEAGTISVVPKPIRTKRNNTTSQVILNKVHANRFTLVNGSMQSYAIEPTFNPANSLIQNKFR